ncbi:MAG: PAS domain S-box protein, partial [Calditrichales bacterium]|nr:PAS domain S-box protein [Calditrichales bacterium]
ESEEKYRQLAETAKDIILLSDLKGNVKYVNREGLRLTGYSEKEALQMNVMDMLTTDCIPATKERFTQRQKGKNDIFVYDAEFFDKKGDKIPIEVKSSLISEKGKPSGVLIIARDITERKLAEETLKNKILELNSFINNIPDMAWLKDTDSRFIAVNRAFCETVGIDAQSLITQSCEVCFGKEAAENFKKDDQKVMKGGKQVIFEEKFLDSQKNNIWLETIKSPIFDESGKVLGIVGIARNINERKQSEKRIERLNNALKAVRSVDQLIIVEKYRNNLLQKTCDIMIETRGYEGAWLGFLKDKKNFDVVKGSGFGEDVSRFINHVISGDHPRCIRNALSGGNSFILIDKSKDCGKCFFKKPCAGKEAAIIHVEHDGKLFGLMAILFGEDISVDDEEKELLNELAGDIGLALHNMELKESSKRSEEALKHKLLALSQPVYEISGLQLTDIIDIDILQKLQDGFAESYSVASLIFDNYGKPITKQSNFSDFCKIIRSTKKGMEGCEIADENITKLAAKNESVITPCKNFKEILNAAVPVFIGDKQVAFWGIGQKVINELAEDKVRGYAKEIGVDAKQLVASSKKLDIGSKEQVERMVSFIKTIAKNISLLGLQNIQQAREITERKQAEETLKESEDKYRRLTETVTDIIFTLNKKGEFTYLSPVFEKVTGYSALDYIGRPFTEVVTPDYIESTVDKFKRGLDGEKIPLYEIELIHKDKRRIPVELNVTSLLDSRGQIIGRHGVARDITIRKQSEEELRKKNEELEIFNKMAVGRELKMIELKKEINRLLTELGKRPHYKIAEESNVEESK